MLLCTGPLRAPCGLCSARGGVKKAQALQSRVAAYWADRLVVAVVSLRLSLAWLPALLASMRVPVTTDLRASTPYWRGFMTPVESQYFAPLGLELEQGEIIELLVLGEPLLELVAVGTPQLLLERAVVLDATLAGKGEPLVLVLEGGAELVVGLHLLDLGRAELGEEPEIEPLIDSGNHHRACVVLARLAALADHHRRIESGQQIGHPL